MSTKRRSKRKSKLVGLVLIGSMIVVLSTRIEHISGYNFSDAFKIAMVVCGITMQLVGLLLIYKEKRQTEQQ